MEVKKKNSVLKRLLAGVLAVCVIGTGLPGTPVELGLLKPAVASAETLPESKYRIVIRANGYSGSYITYASSSVIEGSGLNINSCDIFGALGIDNALEVTTSTVTITKNTESVVIHYTYLDDFVESSTSVTCSVSLTQDISGAKVIVDEDNNYSVRVTLNDEVVSSDDYTVSYQKYYNGEWTDVTAISGAGSYRAVVTAKSDSDYYGTVYGDFDIAPEFLINKYPTAVNNARAGQSDDLVLAGDVENGYILYRVDYGNWGSQDVIPTSESLSVGEHHVDYQIYEDDSPDTPKKSGEIDVYVHHPYVVKTVNGVSVQNARIFTLDQNFLDNDCFTAVDKYYLSGNIEFYYTLLTPVETQTGYATDDKAFSFWYYNNDGGWTRISEDNVEFYADDGMGWVITDSNADSERVYAFEQANVGNIFKITGCNVDSAEYAYDTNWVNIKSYYNNNNSYPDNVVLVRVPLGTIIDTTDLTKVKDFREIPPYFGSYEGADAYDYYIAKTNNSNVVVKPDPIPSAKTFTLVDTYGRFGTKNIKKSENTFTLIGTEADASSIATHFNIFVGNTLTAFTEANGFVEVTDSLTDEEKLINGNKLYSHYYVYTGATADATTTITFYDKLSKESLATGFKRANAIANNTSVDIDYLDKDFLNATDTLSNTKLKKAIGTVEAGETLGSTTVEDDYLNARFIISKEDLSKKAYTGYFNGKYDLDDIMRIYPECFASDTPIFTP